MRAAASEEGLYATDLAEALVRDGVPFREAHRRTGELLKELSAASRSMRELSAEEWASFGVTDGAALLDPDASVRARNGVGGPAPASVVEQADAIGAWLAAR
jgi:argininosuccinate lyase